MSGHYFKPTAFGADRMYSVESGELHCRGGGEDWSLPLEEVQEVYFLQHKAAGQMFWKLDLHGLHASHHVDVAFDSVSRKTSADSAAFIALSDEICAALESLHPGYPMGYSETGTTRTILFWVGGIAVLAAVALLVGAVSSGVPLNRLATGGVAISLLAVTGVLMMRSYNPKRDPAEIPAKRLPRILRYLSGRSSKKS